MSAIAPFEVIPATALGQSSSAAPNDSPSFFDVLTAAGLNPPPNAAGQSSDSSSAITTSSEEDLLAHTPPSSRPTAKNKNALDADTLYPFLPGSIAPTPMLEFTPKEPINTDLDNSSISSASVDSVISLNDSASRTSTSTPSPNSAPVEPAPGGPPPTTPQSDLLPAASSTEAPPSCPPTILDFHMEVASSDCSGVSTQASFSASLQDPLSGPVFGPKQDPSSAAAAKKHVPTEKDLVSKAEPGIAASRLSSFNSTTESNAITTATIAAPSLLRPKDDFSGLGDLQIFTPPKPPSSIEVVSPRQEPTTSSPTSSTTAATAPEKRSPARTVPAETSSAKVQLQNSEENAPAIAAPANAPVPASKHSWSPPPTSSNPRDLEPQTQPSIQTSPANTQQQPGVTPTAQHIPAPVTVPVSDSSFSAPSENGDPSHKTNSSDHKTIAAAGVAPTIAPTVPATGVASIAAANPQPPSGAPVDPHAQGPIHTDSPVHAPLIPESYQTPPASPVHLAQIVNKAAQSEMRIGLTTPAFGSVELRTVVHANEVAVQIGSERGDLKTLLTTELPAITHTLQQHDLRLNQIHFEQRGFAFSSDTSQQRDTQPRSFATKTISASSLEFPPLESASMPELELRPSRGLSILA
jgi:hypothetical protein